MSRRGFTLIEMLAAMTVGSVMLGIGVGILHVLLRAEETGRDRVHQTQVLTRLADSSAATWRGIAADACPGQPAEQWQFALADDRTVTYRACRARSDAMNARRTSWCGKSLTRCRRAIPPSLVRRADAQAAAGGNLIIAREPSPLAAGRKCGLSRGWARIIGSPSRPSEGNSMTIGSRPTVGMATISPR